MNYFFIDFETRSKADSKKVGADNYARDPSTEVISIAYAIDTDNVAHVPGKFLPLIPGNYILVRPQHRVRTSDPQAQI